MVPEGFTDLRSLVDDIEVDGPALLLCMGKGGVGKTTVAAAIALELAHRGHEVLLTTTDPAAHLTETLDAEVEHLTVSRIDPELAITEYRERVMAGKGADLDDAGRAVLAEDLKSPCTDEVAVFQQFSHVVFQSRKKFVVLDTAPTGHTLLLLDATGSYHREITRQMSEGTRFTTPLMRLQDPHQTKVLIVTLPETTPVQEAQELQDDLARAGITPYAWVVNNSLAAASPSSPFLRARARTELPCLTSVANLNRRTALLPMLEHEPVGPAALAMLTTAADAHRTTRRCPLTPATTTTAPRSCSSASRTAASRRLQQPSCASSPAHRSRSTPPAPHPATSSTRCP